MSRVQVEIQLLRDVAIFGVYLAKNHASPGRASRTREVH